MLGMKMWSSKDVVFRLGGGHVCKVWTGVWISRDALHTRAKETKVVGTLSCRRCEDSHILFEKNKRSSCVYRWGGEIGENL